MSFSRTKKLYLKSASTILALFFLIVLSSCENKIKKETSEVPSKTSTFGSKKEISSFLNNNYSDLFLNDSVQKFYSERENLPVWSDIKFRESFIEILRGAEAEGLYFEDYHGVKIDTLNRKLSNLNDTEKSKFDILLTDAFFKITSHLLNGKTDPKKIHEIFDLPKNQENLSFLLNDAITKKDIEIAIKAVRPNHPIYNQLILSLKIFKDKKEEFAEFKDIDTGDMIKPEMQDARMPKIKFRLMALGYLQDIDPFGYDHTKQVQEAIKDLQLENGLLADGIIGNSTIKLLNIDYTDRYNQILSNLERWRWYPRDLGEHFILVNIANYNLDVIKGKDTIRSHKTMVGTEVRKTPIFSEEIKYIVFNPTWTIPPTIKSKDVIPGSRKDPDYTNRKKIDVYNSSGEILNPSEIDWNSNTVNGYTYRQKPGNSNPLGRVKIIYPNKHLIYLHDTPSKSLFARNSRAQSSGCIRVENALDLAEYLLSDQPTYTSEKIEEILEQGRTKEVKMNQLVKVHHFYWTAWMQNGKPRFTEDVYNYDEKIIAELNKISKP